MQPSRTSATHPPCRTMCRRQIAPQPTRLCKPKITPRHSSQPPPRAANAAGTTLDIRARRRGKPSAGSTPAGLAAFCAAWPPGVRCGPDVVPMSDPGHPLIYDSGLDGRSLCRPYNRPPGEAVPSSGYRSDCSNPDETPVTERTDNGRQRRQATFRACRPGGRGVRARGRRCMEPGAGLRVRDAILWNAAPSSAIVAPCRARHSTRTRPSRPSPKPASTSARAWRPTPISPTYEQTLPPSRRA